MTPPEILRAVALQIMLWSSFGLAGAVLAISQDVAYQDPSIHPHMLHRLCNSNATDVRESSSG